NTVAQAPHDPAAYLSQFSSPVPELRWLAEQALNSILASYRIWQAAGYRFAPFRQDYESCLALRNVDTVVSNSRGDVLAEGAIRGVDDDGRLLLEDASGSLVRISTGEVTLRRERA
ncbi:MAG: hypothetical protein LBJ48_02275, partial [Coriobacteriales bacterium]|nr:hypothetical protein [Coriobacteriales bacterium]